MKQCKFGCKDIGIKKFDFVAKTQFLYKTYSLAASYKEHTL